MGLFAWLMGSVPCAKAQDRLLQGFDYNICDWLSLTPSATITFDTNEDNTVSGATYTVQMSTNLINCTPLSNGYPVTGITTNPLSYTDPMGNGGGVISRYQSVEVGNISEEVLAKLPGLRQCL